MTAELRIQRIHCLGGDDEDLGWYSRGHHPEADFRAALEASFWLDTPTGRDRYKHPCEADETRCTFGHYWWRLVPVGRDGGMRLDRAAPGARGAFPVTAMLTPESAL